MHRHEADINRHVHRHEAMRQTLLHADRTTETYWLLNKLVWAWHVSAHTYTCRSTHYFVDEVVYSPPPLRKHCHSACNCNPMMSLLM